MSLIVELKRRNVFRVAAAYVVASWLTIQVIDVLVQLMGVPEWFGRVFVLVLVIGFPVSLVLAWAYELTPEGVKRETEVDRSSSVAVASGRKLDFLIIAVLTVALIVFALDKFAFRIAPSTFGSDEHESPDVASELTAGRRKSVAVVPFDDMSASKNQAWIGEAIATEILTELSKRSDLLLLSRSMSFSIPEEARSSQEIGRYLGADILVEGTVRKVGDRIRVTAQLVSVLDGYQLWADVYETRLSEDFSAEIAIATFFSSQVRAQLAAPFSPNVQLADFSEDASSAFDDLFAVAADAESGRDNTTARDQDDEAANEN